MFVLKFLTHLPGTPLVLVRQTNGPLTKTWPKRSALHPPAQTSNRDVISMTIARDQGYTGLRQEISRHCQEIGCRAHLVLGACAPGFYGQREPARG